LLRSTNSSFIARKTFQVDCKVLCPFKNCTLKSPLANTLRRHDKFFICPNNVCASMRNPVIHTPLHRTEYHNRRWIWNGRRDIRRDVSLKGKKKMRVGRMEKGAEWNKKEKNVCQLHASWRLRRGDPDEPVTKGLAGETDDSTRGWHLNGDVLYVELCRQDDSSSKAVSVFKTKRQKLLKGKSIRRHSLLFPWNFVK